MMWLALLPSLLAVIVAPVAAVTPDGTTISNTAQIDYYTGAIPVAAVSNTVDTFTEFNDTQGPSVTLWQATPSTVVNNGTVVTLSITATDSNGIDTVLADLRLLSKSESIAFTNMGGGSWNLVLVVDSTVMGGTHYLPVAVIDGAGNITIVYIRLVVTDATASYAEIISLGWNMQTGMRIAGNAVTLSVGHSSAFRSVLFEYRAESSQIWTKCALGSWSDANPDTTGPLWGILWDMQALPDGPYYLRATATRTTGETDLSPNFMKVWKDSTDSWVNEWNDTGAGTHVRRTRYSRQSDTVVIVEGTMFTMPASAMASSDTMWIRITVFRNGSPDAPAPLAATGLTVPGDGYYRRFEREDGLSAFDDLVTMEIPYSEAGLAVAEKDLGIYYYDRALRQWILVPDGVVDEARNVVRVRVRHFTDFAVFGAAPAANLSNVLIYPNPFIPYDGDDQTGRPFVRGDATTGIIFKNVTSTVEIDILTIAGRRVSTIRSTNTGGNLQWDARTDDNREVASGVYIAVIRSGTGEQVIKKFMVVR